MASYHLSVKTISRSHGRSATAAAAYRSGEKIIDERTGEVHDYSRKRGVDSAELVLPDDAPDWAKNREALWNAAEMSEKRKNSTVAREFEIALPCELSKEERKKLAHEFAYELVARHQCVADVCIHQPDRNGDERNHHAHILLTTRRLTEQGFGEKTRELDDRKSGEVDYWRARFAELQNERLKSLGHEMQVDHRSLEAQGIERLPEHHLGPAAIGFERRTKTPSQKRVEMMESLSRLQCAREQGEQERAKEVIDLHHSLGSVIQEGKERFKAHYGEHCWIQKEKEQFRNTFKQYQVKQKETLEASLKLAREQMLNKDREIEW